VTGRRVGLLSLILLIVTLSAANLAAEEQEVPGTLGPDLPPSDWPEGPATTARAAILIDADTGQVLMARNADLRLPPASTVKILTALTVVRRSGLDEVVTVGSEVERHTGATVGLAPGDTWTVEQLIGALIARSGNDAAAALASHVAGNIPAFVELMQADAADLGLDGVTIASPDGLGDRDRLSARDLATITRAAIAEPGLAEIMAQSTVTLPGIGEVESRNTLLNVYEGATGVKTGQTLRAGRCMVATATRSERRLLAVVLGAAEPDGHLTDATALLDHGFTFTSATDRRSPLEIRVAGAWVAYGESRPVVLVPGPRDATLTARAPIEAGDGGELTIAWAGEAIATVDLLPAVETSRLPTNGGQAVGAWAADRVYASLRGVLGARSTR
jgi:serine-type D-Ala-D-Ala carboxypeptidase (penicillin-binding protein 5/6)